MLYRYNRQELVYKKLSFKFYLKVAGISTGLVLIGASAGVSRLQTPVHNVRTVIDYDTLVLSSFNEREYTRFMKELNIKFPHIVLAQSKIESGFYSSKIFKENNNLFGMKKPMSRATLAKGTKRGHAYYDHWTESVIDYALFQSRYMSHLKNEEAYLNYLGAHYAEDPKYVSKIRTLIEKENLEFKVDQVW